MCVTDSGPAQRHLLDVTHHVTRFDTVANTEPIIEQDEESRDVVTQEILRTEGYRHTEKARAGHHRCQSNTEFVQEQNRRGEPDRSGGQLLVQRAECLCALGVPNGGHAIRIHQRPGCMRSQHRKALPHTSIEHSPHEASYEARKYSREGERDENEIRSHVPGWAWMVATVNQRNP